MEEIRTLYRETIIGKDSADDRVVVLVTNDGEEVTVNRTVAKMFSTVAAFLQEEDSSDHPSSSTVAPFQLVEVNNNNLQRIVAYHNFFVYEPELEKMEEAAKNDILTTSQKEKLQEVRKDWDERKKEWIQQHLFDMVIPEKIALMKAANYMGATHILDCLAQLIADLITGKTPEQIREVLGLPDDLTREEKQAIIDEYIRNAP